MDNNRWNDWDARCPRKEDSTRNPYYNQPTHSPYRGEGFAIAAMVFGILSLLLNCLVIVPLICGSFSFLFAALAYRRGRRNSHFITYGMFASCMGIISAIVLLVQTLAASPDILNGQLYRQQIQQHMEQQP